jgi:hypothetical protein
VDHDTLPATLRRSAPAGVHPGASAGTFVNQGTFNASGSGATNTVAIAFTNTAIVNVTSGTLKMSGGGSGTGGTYTVSAGATLGFDGSFTLNATTTVSGAGTGEFGSGTVALAGGAVYDVTGGLTADGGSVTFGTGDTISGPVSVSGSSTVVFGAGTTVASPGAVVLTSGTLNVSTGTPVSVPSLSVNSATFTGSDTVTVTGTTTLANNEQMSGTGVTVADNLVLNNSAGFLNLTTRTLESFGTVTLSAGFNFTVSGGATIINEAGATWNQAGGEAIVAGSGGGTFVNQGTFNASGSTTANSIGIAFNNTGTVNVTSGTLTLSGTISQLSGGTLSGGTWEATGGTLYGFASAITTDAAAIVVSGSGSHLYTGTSGTNNALASLGSITSAGSLTIQAGQSFVSTTPLSNAGTVTIGSGTTLNVPYTQTGGTTNVEGTLAAFTPSTALAFNGTSDFVEVPTSATLDSTALTSTLTVEAWINLRQLPSAAGRGMKVLAKGANGNDLELQVETDNKVHFYAGDIFPDTVASNTVLQAGRWYHIAATFQAGNPGLLQIFINGTLDASQSGHFARATTSNPFTIGEDDWNTPFYFDGYIAQPAVWSNVQTQAQIQTEMNNGISGTPSGLVAYWPFNEGSGTTAHDTSGNGNNGLLGNSSTPNASDPAWVSTGTVNLQGGTLSGPGTIVANVTNTGGTIYPSGQGGLGGTLTITGSYTQSGNGVLDLDVGGTSAGQFDVLAVGGAASLGGSLQVNLVNNFTLSESTPAITPLTYASRGGVFRVFSASSNGLSLLPNYVSSPTSLSLEVAAAGATMFFVGSVNNDWGLANNWSSATTPTTTDTPYLGPTATVTFGPNDPASTITGLIVDGTLTLGGGTFSIGSAGASNFNMPSGTLTGGGTVIENGTASWTGGTMTGSGMTDFDGATSISGSVILAGGRAVGGSGATTLTSALNVGTGGGTLSFSGLQVAAGGGFDLTGNTLTNTGTITLTNGAGSPVGVSSNDFYSGGSSFNLGGTLVNTGTVVEQGAGGLKLFDNVILSNQGTYQFTGDGSILAGSAPPNSVVNSATGTIEKTAGSGTSGIQLAFDNQGGTVDAESGTISLQAGGTSTGGSYQANGTGVVDLTGGSTPTFAGSYTGSGTGRVQLATGTLNIASAGASFNFSSGLFVWSGGTVSGSGTLTNIGSGYVTVTGGTLGTTLSNQGTMTQTGGTLTVSGSLTNAGVYNVALTAGGNATTGSGTLTNTGTVELTTGVTATVHSLFANHGGTVTATAGYARAGRRRQQHRRHLHGVLGRGGGPGRHGDIGLHRHLHRLRRGHGGTGPGRRHRGRHLRSHVEFPRRPVPDAQRQF